MNADHVSEKVKSIKDLNQIFASLYKASGKDLEKFAKAAITVKNKMGTSSFPAMTEKDFETLLEKFLKDQGINVDDMLTESVLTTAMATLLGTKLWKNRKKRKEKKKAKKEAKEELTNLGITNKDVINKKTREILDNKKKVTESILDTYNKNRSFVFDTKDGKMAPEVRKYILDFFEEWRASLPVKFELRYIRMIGSMTGYQYNPTSDIDINIMTDLDNKKIWTARRLLPNGHNYPDTNHEIGFWIGGKDDVYNEDNAENIYDLIEDKWIKKAERDVKDVPEEYVLEMSRFFMHGLDAIFGEYDRDVEDFKRLKELDPETQEITHKERKERILIKSQEIKADGDGIEMARNLIFAMMRDGYDDEKRPIHISIEYRHGKEDKRFAVNNLIFKTIDRYGYIDRLNEYRKNFREIKKEIDIEIQKDIPEGSR